MTLLVSSLLCSNVISATLPAKSYIFKILFLWLAPVVNNTAVEPRKNGNKVFIKIEQQSRKNDGFMAFAHATSIQSELKESQQIDEEYLKKFLKAY